MKNLDFSRFHPLDHHFWEPVCWGWHGGIVQHFKLLWEYQRPDPIQYLKCRISKHSSIDYWDAPYWVESKLPIEQSPTGEICNRCYKIKV